MCNPSKYLIQYVAASTTKNKPAKYVSGVRVLTSKECVKRKRRKVKESRRQKGTANGRKREKEKGQEKQPRETPEQPTNLKWRNDLQMHLHHAGSSLAAPRVKRKKPES